MIVIGLSGKALDYDIFIDDAPHMVEAMKTQPGKILILLNQPWNQNVDNSLENVVRVSNWFEVLRTLQVMGAL